MIFLDDFDGQIINSSPHTNVIVFDSFTMRMMVVSPCLHALNVFGTEL